MDCLDKKIFLFTNRDRAFTLNQFKLQDHGLKSSTYRKEMQGPETPGRHHTSIQSPTCYVPQRLNHLDPR
jgi:hypothetical protein